MRKIIKENQKFERLEVSREEAVKIISEMRQETYKLGRLEDIPDGETISFYRNGEFHDLCAGTHVSYTKKIKAFKLLHVAVHTIEEIQTTNNFREYTEPHFQKKKN